jgi:hypothetical protein
MKEESLGEMMSLGQRHLCLGWRCQSLPLRLECVSYGEIPYTGYLNPVTGVSHGDKREMNLERENIP